MSKKCVAEDIASITDKSVRVQKLDILKNSLTQNSYETLVRDVEKYTKLRVRELLEINKINDAKELLNYIDDIGFHTQINKIVGDIENKKNKYIERLINDYKISKAIFEISKIENDTQKAKFISSLIQISEGYLKKLVTDRYIVNIKQDLLAYINLIKPYSSNIYYAYKELLDNYNEYSKTLRSLLEAYDFDEADKLFLKEQNYIDKKTYIQGKAVCIKRYLKSICEKIELNMEQARAIAISTMTKNTLLTARAGSGKTTTIISRAIFALEKEGYKPDDIMILAFNRNAAGEIKRKIADKGYKKFNQKLVRTFHSLAYYIDHPDEELLVDEPKDDVRQFLTNFNAELYHSKGVWTDSFKELFYKYFHESTSEYLENHWTNTNKKERYNYHRNKKLITLSGVLVKSNGEKWIADFLYEHGIQYRYEKVLTADENGLYRPDFTIYDKELKKTYIIEHWGINEFSSNHTVPEDWAKSWFEYRDEMNWKRNHCKRKEVILIETSIRDLENGREEFEKILKKRLEQAGIKCIRLEFDVIVGLLDSRHKDDMARKFGKFIQSAHKCKYTSDYIRSIYKKYHLSERGNAFVELALKVFDKYEKFLKENNQIDFDIMFTRATQKVAETHCNCKICLSKDLKKKIKDIKFLLIDEYQDFSKMFYDLIKEMKKYNKDLKLFCVGDDWQAINGFAGSDLKYFNNFSEIYGESATPNLTINYRSGVDIVNCGNKIMEGYGIPAKPVDENKPSNLYKIYIDDVKIYDENNNLDEQYIYDSEDKNYFGLKHRYFKVIYNIIKNNPQKTYQIMHRLLEPQNFEDLSCLKNAILNKLKKDRIKFNEANLKMETIHKFKGDEADTVIILECDNDYFPLNHPDNEIDIIFGRTMSDILLEEQHLFYVAVTRAKENVYFLYEKAKEIDFIKDNSNIIQIDPNIL